MIGYLSGTVKLTTKSLLVVCNGVGYVVLVTQSTKLQVSSNKEVQLFIHSHIKEDAFDLYGFLTETEKELFLKLIGVDGVGPKTALGIMNRGVEEIVRAVRSADVAFFTSVPRVGKKSAQKIIIELRTKLGAGIDLDLSEPEGKEKEVLEALISLGFSENEGRKVMQSFDIEPMRLEDAVKKAIQLLSRK
ncbi:MAG TPA: Holliday junction branch migration protein RuvA [Patescibacteria group bacterium]|nr:Holliday junction branch migration protein RuvA [Patescibacteria group bacterium]